MGPAGLGLSLIVRVGIVGAGAIGGFLAAELAAGGAEIVLVHRRPPSGAVPRPFAITIHGKALDLPTSALVTDRLDTLADVDACLVAVKSASTEEVGAALAPVVPERAIVVSFQNGLRNAARLRSSLGDRATAGVVTYNVQVDAQGCRRQLTSGKLFAGRTTGDRSAVLQALADTFRRGGDPLELVHDVDDVLAGKLLLNLNNGVCAATGLGIAASLRDRDARACFARCILEGLAVMKKAGLRPARVSPLPPRVLAHALQLPDALVTTLARGLVSVDAAARSSTLQDLDRGNLTEIDELNGAIVELATSNATRAPANAVITSIVREHERDAIAGRRPSFLSARELRARVESAR